MRGSGGSRIRNPAVFPESPVTLRQPHPGPAREGSSGRSLGDASHGSLRHHGSSGGRSPSHKDPTRRLAGAQGRQLSGSVARVDSHSTSARFVGHRYASASTARSSAGRQSGGSKASFGLGGGLPKLDTSGLGRLSAGGASSVAQVRYRALSALPDVEEARLHKATLRFRDQDVEAKYGQFRRGSLSDVLVWHLVGGCGIAVAVTVGDMLVFGRFEVLVVAAIALMVLWAGSVCLAVSSPRWFSAVNTGFCAALMMVMCAQPFADDGDLAGPYSGMFVTESARQLLPWAPLIPVVVGLGWKSTVVSSSVWLVSVACAAMWWWPLESDEASVQLVCQSAGVTIVVLVAAYRSTRLRRQAWYLQRGSPAALARHVAHARAQQPPRAPQEFMLPLARVVDLLVSSARDERNPHLCDSLQSCLNVVYTHGNFIVPPSAHQRMLEEMGQQNPFIDKHTKSWMRRELVQQVPMLSQLATTSRLTLDATQDLLKHVDQNQKQGQHQHQHQQHGHAPRHGGPIPVRAELDSEEAKGDDDSKHSSSDGDSPPQTRPNMPRIRPGHSAGNLKEVPRGRMRSKSGGGPGRHARGGVVMVGAASAPVAPVVGLSDEEVLAAEGTITDWAFDMVTWGQKCRHPLTWTTETLLFRFGIAQKLNLHSQVLRRLLTHVEDNYCFDTERPNSYHNALHAAFVVQAVGHFMSVKAISGMLHDLDGLAVLLAAAVHDFRHPGVSNNFLITTQSKLAIRYNDISVLENFHCAEAFTLLQQPMYNVLSDLGKEKKAHVRFVVIQCVLATDLSHGQQFTNMFKAKVRRGTLSSNAEDKLLTMQVLLKCADVSHPARPLRIHKRWSDLISEEFYSQGDLEREQGLPVSPLCDRMDANLPRSQRGFIDFVCRPCFVPFGKFCKVDMWTEMLRLNKTYWRSQAQEMENSGRTQPAPAGMSDSRQTSVSTLGGEEKLLADSSPDVHVGPSKRWSGRPRQVDDGSGDFTSARDVHPVDSSHSLGLGTHHASAHSMTSTGAGVVSRRAPPHHRVRRAGPGTPDTTGDSSDMSTVRGGMESLCSSPGLHAKHRSGVSGDVHTHDGDGDSLLSGESDGIPRGRSELLRLRGEPTLVGR